MDSSGAYIYADTSEKYKTSFNIVFNEVHFTHVENVKIFMEQYVYNDKVVMEHVSKYVDKDIHKQSCLQTTIMYKNGNQSSITNHNRTYISRCNVH